MEKLSTVITVRFTELERDEMDAMVLEYHGGHVPAIRSGRAWLVRLCWQIVRRFMAEGILRWEKAAVQGLLGIPGMQREFDFDGAMKRPARRVEELQVGETGRLAKTVAGGRQPLRFSGLSRCPKATVWAWWCTSFPGQWRHCGT